MGVGVGARMVERATWEDRLAAEHLPHDAAHAPHVDAQVIGRRAEQDLRRAVPAGIAMVSMAMVRGVAIVSRAGSEA